MRRRCQYLAAGLCGAAIIGTAQAQDGGAQAGLTLSPGLSYEDEETRARLGFGARFDSITPTQRFGLAFDGAFDSGYDDIRDSLRAPRLALTYGMESRASALDARLSYQRDRISTLVFSDDLDSDFLVTGTGQRADLNASTSLTFGREAPFGGTVDLGYRSRDYQDTADPTLLDEETRSAGVALRFVIDPRLTARLGARVSQTDEDAPGTDQRRVSLNTGIDIAVNPALDASLTIGTTRITDTGPLGRDTTEGATAALSATQDMPNGTLSGRITTNVTTGGRLTTLEVDRALDLPRGTLSFGAGLGQIDDGDLQTLARLSWREQAPRAEYGVSLDHRLAVDRDGDSAINSQISLSWQQELDTLSRFGADLSLRDTNRLDAGAADTRQTSLSLSFRRDLTPDWGLRTSYTHRWSRETGTADSDDSTVFIGLERGFQWRP
ncbi:hypothetical protein [Yoonia sp.]|uniref:hypothetical protein n=1 Tax=Yoonia sp. TaxID=2212373 RepID=UPI0019EB4420|nr:hypothetical protein [Yoonia sp.]MBE0414342.1 hypothetical protein [Yoonia sp.]